MSLSRSYDQAQTPRRYAADRRQASARIVGTAPGYIVVQIGAARPICLSFEEFDAKSA